MDLFESVATAAKASKSVRIAPGHTVIPDSAMFGAFDEFDAEDSMKEKQYQNNQINQDGLGVDEGMGFDANQSMAFGLGAEQIMNGFDDFGVTVDPQGIVSDNLTGEYYFESVSAMPKAS